MLGFAVSSVFLSLQTTQRGSPLPTAPSWSQVPRVDGLATSRALGSAGASVVRQAEFGRSTRPRNRHESRVQFEGR